ncbi:hypothetical protein CF8_0207 [Aeromonas phage CF8]|nr:hypothetical protein CF8_0207 [Aeromonas phage CF8]
MSILFSCFVNISELKVNGSTSPLGELTNETQTYAKAPDYYYVENQPCELVGFRGINQSNTSSRYEKIPQSHVAPVMGMLNWLYEQADAGNLNDSSQVTLQALQTNYTLGWVWKAVGKMVTNNAIWLPSSIDFTHEVGGVVHEFKIWFANAAFAVEFPYREIYVIDPIDIADIDFFAEHNYKEVRNRLNEETPNKRQQREDLLVGTTDPYTRREIIPFDIYDLVNQPQKNTGYWTIIYYGNPNDAEEEVYEAIRNNILAHSKYDEVKWEQVIPDLFNPLEFIVIPHWNELGLVNETALGSTYSPIFTYQGGDVLAKKYADFYSQEDIIKSLQIVPDLYKSAKMSFVGKPQNNAARILISGIYPDYQLIPSTDSQAGMMSKETAEFIKDLEEMLAAGEVTTPDGLPPKGMQRVIKAGRLYISKRTGNVKLTMITRYQFIEDGLIDG